MPVNREKDSFDSARRTLRVLLAVQSARNGLDYREMGRLTAALDEEAAYDVPWSRYDDAELMVLLAEYQTLRQESLSTITNRAQILMLGLAAIAALGAAPFALGDPMRQVSLTLFLFSYAIPTVSLCVLLTWIGETMRMKRVSEYLASEIEPRINRKLGRLVLAWEACLKTGVLPRDGKLGPSAAVLVLYWMISVLSPLAGLQATGTEFRWWGLRSPLPELWYPWALCAASAAYLFTVRHRFLPGPAVVSSVLCSPSPTPRTPARLD